MSKKSKILLAILLGAIAVAGGLKAITNQSLDNFKVSQEVEADQAVPFPVDI